MPPISTTTASPALQHPVGALRGAGWPRSGPEATMVKSTCTWPSARIASAISAPTCRSVRPGPQPAGHLGVHPVDGRAGLAQRGDLGWVLAHPQVAQRRAGQHLAGPGQRIPQLQDHQGPHLVGQPGAGHRPQPVRDQRVRVLGLLPGDQLQAEPGRRGGLGRGQLEPRHHQEGRVAAAGIDQAGQPFELLGVVAGHVAQVGAGRQQQCVQSFGPHPLGHGGQPAGRVQL